MKSTLSFFLLLAIYSGFVSGWIGLEKADEDTTNYVAHCNARTYNTGDMEKGEVKRVDPETCAIAECLENRDVKYTGCAPVAAEPPCRILPGNNSKPFPDCCYEYVC